MRASGVLLGRVSRFDNDDDLIYDFGLRNGDCRKFEFSFLVCSTFMIRYQRWLVWLSSLIWPERSVLCQQATSDVESIW